MPHQALTEYVLLLRCPSHGALSIPLNRPVMQDMSTRMSHCMVEYDCTLSELTTLHDSLFVPTRSDDTDRIIPVGTSPPQAEPPCDTFLAEMGLAPPSLEIGVRACPCLLVGGRCFFLTGIFGFRPLGIPPGTISCSSRSERKKNDRNIPDCTHV
jgi:hypothetical protein